MEMETLRSCAMNRKKIETAKKGKRKQQAVASTEKAAVSTLSSILN